MAENVLDIMVALYPFKAQNDTELSFSKGDRLEILDRPSSDPEWFKVRSNKYSCIKCIARIILTLTISRLEIRWVS